MFFNINPTEIWVNFAMVDYGSFSNTFHAWHGVYLRKSQDYVAEKTINVMV